MGFWLYLAFLLLAVLAGAGALAFLDRLCRLATGRPPSEDVPSRPHAGGDRPAPGTTPGPGAGRHASVSRADPGDRPAPALGFTAGAGRQAFPPEPAGAAPAEETRPVPVVDAARAAADPHMDYMTSGAQGDVGDLAAVLGPTWCPRGWHDGDCCEGSRTQWGGTVAPRPYLGSS